MGFPKSLYMRKMLLILLLFVSSAASLQAQTFEEWFQQKKTQKKYLIQQIAALQVYIGYLQKGYKIAKEGLTTISGFTKGEFDLHTGYINSLKAVNPEIRRYIKIADIISLQVKIVQNCNKAYRSLSNSNSLTGKELDYISGVFARLLDDCEKTLDELLMVITDGKLEMKDDERIEWIDKLYLGMQDKFTFSQNFANDANVLAASRLKEKTDIQTSRVLNGIKKD